MAGIVLYSIFQNINKELLKTKSFSQFVFLGVYSIFVSFWLLDEYVIVLMEEYFVPILIMLIGFLLSMILPFNVPEILYLLPLNVKERKSYLKWSLVFKIFCPVILFLIIEIPLVFMGKITFMDTVVLTSHILLGLISLSLTDAETHVAYDNAAKSVFLIDIILYVCIIRERFDEGEVVLINGIFAILLCITYFFIFRVAFKYYKEKMREVERNN